MTPEQKVVSLETAKKLKEAEFPQDTERRWDENGRLVYDVERMDTAACVAAPDAQEIGALLPMIIHAGYGDWQFGERKVGEVWWNPSGTKKSFEYLDEAEARAAAWLWLKEQGLT